MTDKNQKYITIKGERFLADIEFIPILKELNRLGLKTTQHCSGHGNNDSYISILLTSECEFYFSKIDNFPRLVIRWNRHGKSLYTGGEV